MRLDPAAQPLEGAPAEHVDLQVGLLQPRVAVDAAGDDDLTPALRGAQTLGRVVFDADRAAVLDQDAGRLRVGGNRQIGAGLCRAQIGPGGAPAPAVGGRRLVVTDALLARAVE